MNYRNAAPWISQLEESRYYKKIQDSKMEIIYFKAI
jgi:hypothetical protein